MALSAKRRRLSADGSYTETPKDEGKREEAVGSSETSNRRSLFVRSLAPKITTDRLAEIFSQTYPIKHATLVLDPVTKLSRGFGFVTFADAEDAASAAAEFNNSSLDGRTVKVEIAEPRHRELVENERKSRPSAKAIEVKAERERKKQETAPPRLIIRNLPWSIKDSDDLALLFRSYGKVKHAVVPRKGPKTQAGFGFVVLRGRKNAERAIEGVNGKEIDGRTLAVDWAVDKKTWEDLQKETDGVNNAATGKQAEEEPEYDFDQNPDSNRDEESQIPDGNDRESDADPNLVIDDSNAHLEVEDPPAPSEEDQDEDSTPSNTVFVRNLPYNTDDNGLHEHFSKFGAVRYARVVYDPNTDLSKGSGFVCFYNSDDVKRCIREAPKSESSSTSLSDDKKRRGEALTYSVLQNSLLDPTGRYTLSSRILDVTRALSKSHADRLTVENTTKRDARDHDKRRLYLLSEGTISKSSPLYKKLSPTEINMREASFKQRHQLTKKNPALHMSLTRLSIRNIPRNVSSKDLKALAREAVVEFATDVKAGRRAPLTKDELRRSADASAEAEHLRKVQGKGIVRQAKIVLESREGTKVGEKNGGGRSRGYGFVEYATHRNALMGLRWLNGHQVKAGGEGEGRHKRLIVEFAIENAQVVGRRREREVKARVRTGKKEGASEQERSGGEEEEELENTASPGQVFRQGPADKKRKRNTSDSTPVSQPSPKQKTGKGFGRALPSKSNNSSSSSKHPTRAEPATDPDRNKVAKRNRIIAKKRYMRKARKGGK